MKIDVCTIPGVLILTPERIKDHRGYLAEVWNLQALADAGAVVSFVQENIAVSPAPFTVRGLHFQAPPHAQAKLMRVPRGRARYAVVDLRRSSSTYGQSFVCELDAAAPVAIYTPVGFAHGIVTQVPDTEIAYQVSSKHVREAERSLRWDDPTLSIDWQTDATAAVVSDKDRAALYMDDFSSPFA